MRILVTGGAGFITNAVSNIGPGLDITNAVSNIAAAKLLTPTL